MDFSWCLSRVIHGNKREVIAPMSLGKMLCRDVGAERPDVPGTDAKDVGHAPDASCVSGRNGFRRYRMS